MRAVRWLAFLALTLPLPATAADCLSDAVIDRALGERVRSGSGTVDPRGLPDLPLCSGLTLAQQIQRMRAAAFPEEQRRADEVRQARVAREVPLPAPPLPPVAVIQSAPRPPKAKTAVVIAPVFVAARASSRAATPAVRRSATPRPAARRQARTRAAAAAVRSGGPRFGSCREARAHGYSRMRPGQPGYSGNLDRDGDGIACE